MVLIGLVGFKRSGKDTFADYLVKKYDFKKQAFADPVKKICRIMFHLSPVQLDDLKETPDKRWGLTPRQMMQTVGTDMVRGILGEDFWVRNMDMRTNKGDNIVVSDVRFLNEAEWIKKNNGVLVRIIDGTQHTDTHLSETEQLSIQEDARIFNQKTNITEFHQEIERLLETIFV